MGWSDKFLEFLKESYSELQKVSWLSQKEVMGSTVVIMILICILSVFVALIDFVLLRLVRMVL